MSIAVLCPQIHWFWALSLGSVSVEGAKGEYSQVQLAGRARRCRQRLFTAGPGVCERSETEGQGMRGKEVRKEVLSTDQLRGVIDKTISQGNQVCPS